MNGSLHVKLVDFAFSLLEGAFVSFPLLPPSTPDVRSSTHRGANPLSLCQISEGLSLLQPFQCDTSKKINLNPPRETKTFKQREIPDGNQLHARQSTRVISSITSSLV